MEKFFSPQIMTGIEWVLLVLAVEIFLGAVIGYAFTSKVPKRWPNFKR